jgi:hypothetical protein
MSDSVIVVMCAILAGFLWLLAGTAVAIKVRALITWDEEHNQNFWTWEMQTFCTLASFPLWPIAWLMVLLCSSHPREKQRMEDEEALHQKERKFRAAIQTEKMMRRVEAEEEFDRSLLTQGRQV